MQWYVGQWVRLNPMITGMEGVVAIRTARNRCGQVARYSHGDSTYPYIVRWRGDPEGAEFEFGYAGTELVEA